MIGFEMHLPSGAKAEGMLFTDGSLYVHEPISDSWSSVDDLRKDWPDAVVEIIGPVVGFEAARRELQAGYECSLAQLKESFQQSLANIARFEKLAKEA